MNQDQKSYLIRQIRDHATWQLNNTKLTIPTQWTEVEVAHELDARGFVINQRPVLDVTLPPTEEMEANLERFNEYLLKVNALTGGYVDAILAGSKDNPGTTLQEFIRDLAAIES